MGKYNDCYSQACGVNQQGIVDQIAATGGPEGRPLARDQITDRCPATNKPTMQPTPPLTTPADSPPPTPCVSFVENYGGKGGKGSYNGFVVDICCEFVEFYRGKGGKGSKGYAYYEDGFTGIKGSKYGSGGFTGGAKGGKGGNGGGFSVIDGYYGSKGGKGGIGLTAVEFGVNVNTYVEGGSGYEYSYQTENGQVVAAQASGEAWSSF